MEINYRVLLGDIGVAQAELLYLVCRAKVTYAA
jgi:hypothetical protein